MTILEKLRHNRVGIYVCVCYSFMGIFNVYFKFSNYIANNDIGHDIF